MARLRLSADIVCLWLFQKYTIKFRPKKTPITQERELIRRLIVIRQVVFRTLSQHVPRAHGHGLRRPATLLALGGQVSRRSGILLPVKAPPLSHSRPIIRACSRFQRTAKPGTRFSIYFSLKPRPLRANSSPATFPCRILTAYRNPARTINDSAGLVSTSKILRAQSLHDERFFGS